MKAKPAAKKASAMEEEAMEEPEESEPETKKPAKGKFKGNDGQTVKQEVKPTVFKKGKWNPKVELATSCQQFSSQSAVPRFDCSTRNSNREVIRAANIGSKKLLEKIVQSDHKISRLTERWGIDNDTTALKVILDKGNKDLLITFLEYLNDEKKTIKYGTDNVVYIDQVDTGYNDRYAYGVATRKVALSRGGRQGNNALVEEQNFRNLGKGLDDDHIDYILSSHKTTTETLKTILSYYPTLENQLISHVNVAMRFGNRDLASYLIERSIKNQGYGLSEFYLPALNNKSEKGVLSNIKKPNCTKKAFGMGNISPIHCACLNPHGEVLKHLLSVNPEYQNIDDSMRKPVHYAACCESVEPLKVLVSLHVDTRDYDNMRTTPLMYASRAGRIENVKYLLEENRSIIGAKDRHGYSAIHYAAEYGHIEIVKLLLDHGIKISLGGPERKTALHIAAANGNKDMVVFLLERGAKVTVKDKLKRTPLLLASKNGNLEIASYLLQQGSPFDDADSSGNSPLHYACAYGYPEVIDALIQAGANPNSVNSWNLSPTAVALLKSYFSCLRKMLDNPATNVNCIDNQGRTLVSRAIGTINADNFNHVAFLLKDKKADPNIADSNGLTAFDYLCAHQIDTLVNQEIKPNMNLEEINTIKADKKNLYKKYIKLFLECGADVNHRDSEGSTPLFRAITNGNVEAAICLLELPRTQVDILTNSQKSIFHYLESLVGKEGFLVIVEKLVAKSGNNTGDFLNKYAKNGKTPIISIFEALSTKVDGIRGEIYQTLDKELRLSKKPRSDEPVQQLNTTGGLFGGARTKMTARKSTRAWPRAGFGAQNSADVTGTVITAEEQTKLNEDADNKAADRINESLEVFKLLLRKGGDFNAQIKKPVKEKVPKKEGEEENEEEVDDDLLYDIMDYFKKYNEKMRIAVESKIEIPEKEKIPENVGYTLLHLASNCQKIEIYKFLIEQCNMKLNVSSVHGESELLRFISKVGNGEDNSKILEYLIQKGLNFETSDLKKVTPILMAAINNKEYFIKTLIGHKANINAQDSEGRYPLMQAVKNKSLPIVELLLANKANPNLIDENKRNCIHWAINLSNADADASNEIENCLLSSGGDLNALDARGRTPLHYVFVKIGDPFNITPIDPIETVANIISRPGVLVDVRDVWGGTPLNYAAQRGAAISAMYLLKKKANINNQNSDKNTPLNEALLSGHQNICNILIQSEASLKIPVTIHTAEEKKAELTKRLEEEKKKKEAGGVKTDLPKGGMDIEEDDTQNVKLESDEEDSDDKKIKDEDDDSSEHEEEEEDAQPQFGYPRKAVAARGFGKGFGKSFGKQVFGGGYNNPFGASSGTVVDELKFGKDEKECSTFSIAIRRNWQACAFLMLENGFDLSLAILDCFAFKKYNYVYTLLLKKAESGVYQTTNAQKQNLTHLFAANASKISTELYDKILAKLESKNLDFKSLDASGKSSLHYASESGCLKLIEHLLNKGLDINKSDNDGSTPLGVILKSSFGNVIGFVEIGKRFKLDLNQLFKDAKKQHTALTYIIQKNKNFDTFTKLVQAGADINKGDSDGWTPLIHYIRLNKLVEIKNLLENFKVDTKIVDKEGRTIVHHIVCPLDFGSYENVDMLEFLAPKANFNAEDKKGVTPLGYASQQQSGKLSAVLTKMNAHDSQIRERTTGVRRATTSILNELEFPNKVYNFEDDFEKFVQSCKTDADTKKTRFDERVKVDANAVGNYEVVYDGEDPYDAYMVKVEINYGYYSGNTFYKMQILREKVRDIYIVFTRWGRVGTPGQFQQTPFSNLEEARKEYCSIFKSKSGNMWEDRHNFVKTARKYRLIPFAKKNKFESYIKAFNYSDPKIPKTQLAKPIFNLLRRTSNYKIITNALKTQYNWSEEELPLQNISRERVLDAQAVLDAIKKTLKVYEDARRLRNLAQIQDYAEELTKLTSEFYELIPTTQYKDHAIPPITNQYQLTNLERMMNDLFYFEIAIKIIGAATFNLNRINPIDYCFNCLSFKMMKLEDESPEFNVLK